MLSSLQSLVQLAGGHVVNGLLEGIFIAAFIAAFLCLLGRGNSKTRFAIWFLTLLSVAVLPFIAFDGSPTGIAAGVPHFDLSATWAEIALLIWAVLAFAGLARIAFALTRLWDLKRSARELSPSEFVPELRHVFDECRSHRKIRLCVSDTHRVPTAVGFFRPAVILPRWVLEELSPAELKAVLLHEVGHLQRCDDWTNLAQKVLRAVFFFHPAVWWIDSRLNLEREMACDDLVLAATANARGYAECLVSVAEKSAARSRLALALAAVSRMKATALRITRILDSNRTVETRISRAAVSAMAAMSALAFLALPHTPALVAFQAEPAAEQVVAAARSQGVNVNVVPARYEAEHFQPKVIDADIRYSNANEFHRAVKDRAQQRRSRIHVRPNRETMARVTQASFRQEQPAQSVTLLLLVETSAFDGANAPDWTICVWQFGTAPANAVQPPMRMRNGTSSKSI